MKYIPTDAGRGLGFGSLFFVGESCIYLEIFADIGELWRTNMKLLYGILRLSFKWVKRLVYKKVTANTCNIVEKFWTILSKLVAVCTLKKSMYVSKYLKTIINKSPKFKPSICIFLPQVLSQPLAPRQTLYLYPYVSPY